MATVKVDLESKTCQRLSSFGLRGESYDAIINRLIDQLLLLRELSTPLDTPEQAIP